MGFGEDLWCPQAHAAVVRLLDSELHLMEAMKKWMGQRAKSERDFSVQLHCMAAIVEKMERSQHCAGLDYISQLNKVRFHTQTQHCATSKEELKKELGMNTKSVMFEQDNLASNTGIIYKKKRD